MSGLRTTVLLFTETARANPGWASDPKNLRALERETLSTLVEGMHTDTLHRAPETWEIKTLLRGSQLQTGRVALQLPWAAEIIAMRPSIQVLVETGELFTPNIDSIDVQIDCNQEDYLTNAGGLTTVNGFGPTLAPVRDPHFVSLGSIDVGIPRAFGLYLPSEQATLGFVFRWTQPLTTAGAIYHSTYIKVSIDGVRISPHEAAQRQAIVGPPKVYEGFR